MLSYCISDLHLPAGPSELTDRFAQFCACLADCAEQIYILGDLVDAWLGDDAGLEAYPQVVACIADLVDAGVAVTLLSGNHDFLYGEAFRRACGALLAPDPLIVRQAGQAFLLSHGDALCTADTAYQTIRSSMRSAAWQKAFLDQSLAERQAFAARLRQTSNAQTAEKSLEIMDVSADAVHRLHRETGVPTLIHGHTHRPKVHANPGVEGFTQRYVLGAWHDNAQVVRIDNAAADLISLEQILNEGA